MSKWPNRMALWVEVGSRLAISQDPFIEIELQSLGSSERLLLQMERDASNTCANINTYDELDKLSDLVAISRLWIFGLYETIRTFRQKVGNNSDQFKSLQNVFQRIERIRMPLAKHALKGDRRMYYPQASFVPSFGMVGWQIIDDRDGTIETIWRTPTATEFLEAVLGKELVNLPGD